MESRVFIYRRLRLDLVAQVKALEQSQADRSLAEAEERKLAQALALLYTVADLLDDIETTRDAA